MTRRVRILLSLTAALLAGSLGTASATSIAPGTWHGTNDTGPGNVILHVAGDAHHLTGFKARFNYRCQDVAKGYLTIKQSEFKKVKANGRANYLVNTGVAGFSGKVSFTFSVRFISKPGKRARTAIGSSSMTGIYHDGTICSGTDTWTAIAG